MNRKSLFIFLLLKAYLFASGDGSYIVVAPDTIQSNNEYSVSISLPGNTEPTTVEVEISGGSFTAAKTIDVPEYNTAVAKFNVPILENAVYTLKVQGIKGYEFVNTTQLKYVERENISDYLRNDGGMKTILNQNTTTKRFGPLNLKFKREKYRIFRDVVIKVNSTNPIPYLIYDVVVKGNIIKHEYLEVSGENTMEYITITPTSDMIPKANIYVYYLENGTLLWDDLSLFFATKSKCLKNDTEYDRLVANGEVEELDFRKPPGEESHLVTLTNMHYVLEGGPNSMYIQYLYHSLYTMVAKMNVNLRRLLICDTFSPGNSSPDHTLHSANSYKASCNTAFINSDYMKKKMYSRSIAKSMLYSLDRIEEIVREHRQKTNNLNLPQTNIFADINIRNIQTTSNNTCSVCQQRDKTKQESLESIKRNILSRLHLSYPPNVPTRPVVPNNILDSFQTQCAYKGVLAESRLKKDFPLHKIPAMAPATFSLNEFIALYTADDELMAQQTHVDFSHYTKRAEEVKTSRWILNTVHRDSTNTHNTPQNSGTNHGWYTSLNSVYIFPKKLQMRHNRRADVFNFIFDGDALQFTRTILHVFLWGYDWIAENNSDILYSLYSDNYSKQRKEIVITIYKAFRYLNSTTHAYKWIESRHKIPNGIGHWVEIEIEQLHFYWMKNQYVDQFIIVRGKEPWMRSAFSTGVRNNSDIMTLYLEVASKNKGRAKRNAGLDCQENDNEIRCCRYPLKINFTNFGWNFIVAPQHFEAYFCNGECNVGYLEKYTHTHITSLTISAKPCCSPQKLSALTLLYFDMTMKLMYSTIPNMSVEKCSCS